MTMTGSSTSVANRNIGDSDSPSQVSASVQAATPSSIKAILLADGWHTVKNCSLVQFALGEAQSPITPTRLYPFLMYTTDGNRTVYTPIQQVLGFDISS